MPVLILSILCFLVGAGLRGRDRGYTALGLLFGAIGDYLIGRSNDGLIVGAIFFGIGHIFYLVSFPFIYILNIFLNIHTFTDIFFIKNLISDFCSLFLFISVEKYLLSE